MNTRSLSHPQLLIGRPQTMNEHHSSSARFHRVGALVLAAALSLPVTVGFSQEEAAVTPSDAPSSAEGAAAVPEPAEPAPAGPSAAPESAEMSPRAIRGLLLDIAYTGQRLIAVGERGNIVASRDGIRWAQVAVPVRSTLTGVSFVDDKNGWAVGHDATIIHTADGGQTWNLQSFKPELLKPLHDVFFLDTMHGYAFGAFGLFFSTSDGGKNWSRVEAPTILEDGYHLNGMTRLKDGAVLIVGESGLLGLSRDGTTWERLPSPYEGSFFGAVARGDKGAMVFGLRGNAYVSDDVRSGQWRKVNLATISSIFGGAPMSDGSIVLAGADAVVLTVLADETVERVVTFAGVASSGTISGIVRWPGGLMTVGESGVQPYQTKLAPTTPVAVTRELETTKDF
jgi:photosystem II stability/assembly factor-like uncharacterized protein